MSREALAWAGVSRFPRPGATRHGLPDGLPSAQRRADRITRDTTVTEQHVFWHRDLPPLDADPIGEHVVEASSDRVASTLAHRDELWDQCYRQLLAHTVERIEQELSRLGGHYAHVIDEHLDSKRDDVAGESWLHGRFTYVLYRTTSAPR